MHRFKAHLTVVLLSVLFIVIPSQLQLSQLQLLDGRVALFVAAVLFVVRPLSVALSTIGAPMRREDKLLLGWIAPRGIVAAATAGIFGPALVAEGHADAALLLPVTFAVIIATVLAHGLSIGRIARRLRLASGAANGLMIVGASPWSCALGSALKNLGLEVLMVDGAYGRLKAARMNSLPVYHGEILSDHAEHTMETQHLSHVLCATDNDFYNALVCKSLGEEFGQHRTFQLATDAATGKEVKQLAIQQRGYFAFDAQATYDRLNDWLDNGWEVQATKLTKAHGWSELAVRLGERGKDWLLLGGVSPDGAFRLYAKEQPFKLEAGWTALFFAPVSTKPPKGPKGRAEKAPADHDAPKP